MCGIGGIVQADEFDRDTQLKSIKLLFSLQDRGENAFGIYLKKKNKNHNLFCGEKDPTLHGELFKSQGSVREFFIERDGKINLKRTKMILFHTRAETKGTSAINENNHPFNTKDFVLAHNGVIHNDEELKKKYDIKSHIEVDSFVIVALIQKYYDEGYKIPEAIKKTTEELSGGFSCWLLHKPTGDLYLFRETYPMSYYIDKKEKKFYFASTPEHLNYIGVDYTDIEEIEEETIYKLEDFELKKIDTFRTTRIPAYSRRYGYTNNYSGYTTETAISVLDKIDTSLVHLYNIFENYENSSHTNTVISLVDNKIVLLVKPKKLVSLLDNIGFERYKSTSFTGYSEYTKYDIKPPEKINQLVQNLSMLTMKDLDNSDIIDIIDALGLEVVISEQYIDIHSNTKPSEFVVNVLKRAGLSLNKKNGIRMSNKEKNREKIMNLSRILREEGIFV